MTDIEHDLRELFHERADRIVTAQGAPERVLRRGRRRQLGTVVLGSLVALTLVAGSIVSLRGLLGDRPGQGAAGETDSTIVATGDASGLSWTLSAWNEADRYCTRLRWRLDTDSVGFRFGSASCGSMPAHDRATFGVTDDPEHVVSLLVALVPADVVRVEVRTEDAQRFSTPDLADAPVEWGALRFAVVPLEGRGSGAVHFLGNGEDIVYPSVGFRWGQAPDITQFATVPGDVTARIGSIELEGNRRTLYAWRETGTSKFCLFLGDGGGSLEAMAWCSTAQYLEDVPILSIGPLACDRRVGVLWGTVPGDVAAIEVLHRPGRFETIAGPPVLGDVRFVLSPLEEPYPGSAWIRFLNADGVPTDQDWLSASCFERPPQPPEA
jgi:hypothetical protein